MDDMQKKKSYNKMAEELGVSANAIYLTLKNKKGVSKALREKICNYALESGYGPEDLPSGKEILFLHVPEDDARGAVIDFVTDKLNYRSFTIQKIPSAVLDIPVIADCNELNQDEIHSLPDEKKLIIELFSDTSLRDAIMFEFMNSLAVEDLDANITEEHIRDIDEMIVWRKNNPSATARRCLFRDHLKIRENSIYIEAKTHDEILSTKGNVLQIAQKLDSSPYNVNRIINGEDTTPSDTREKILQKANELGYEKIYENKTIKLLYVNDIPKIQTNTYKNFFEYLQEAVKSTGNDIIIAEYISRNIQEILKSVESFKPDGLIALVDQPVFLESLMKELSIPVISVGIATDLPVDIVRTDNTYSFRQIFEYYKNLGVNRLGYFSITEENSSANEFRLKRCRENCESMGIEFDENWIIKLYTKGQSEAYRLAGEGKAALEKCLDNADFPDAFFSFNDYSTLIFSHILSELKRDVILTSWDNDELLKPFTFKKFPSIASDKESQAREAVHTLLGRIKHPNKPEKTISIRTRLVAEL